MCFEGFKTTPVFIPSFPTHSSLSAFIQALNLNKNSETFRNHILALEHIKGTYNGIINTLLPVEQAMIAQELDKINQELEV